PPADFFHHLLFSSRTFGFAFRRERFGPFSRSPWSFTPPLPGKGQQHLELVLLPLVAHRVLRPTRRSWLFGPSTSRSTMPAADSRPTLKMDRSILSHDLRDMRRVSRSKFDRLRRATAGFTTAVLSGPGLRCPLPARPTP